MVIDTSAVIAILLSEPERDMFIRLIQSSSTRLISAATLLEASMVIDSRKGEPGRIDLDLFIRDAALEVMAVTQQQAEIAPVAFRRFGKGRPPAQLNFGDCFSYAAAKATGEPLLFKGSEFSKTDLLTVPI